ncbi:coupling protein TraD [Escherichia coli]|nr:coupling protein TraD [Escherichia coli]
MSFNAKDMTQGGQIASMRIRMFSQIANIMLYCLFIFFWILVGLVLWVKISWQTFVNGCIGNDSNLLIVFYVQIMPDDFVMQLHRF